MRLLGQVERAFEIALIRASDPRKLPRGRMLGRFDSNTERFANMRMQIDALYLVALRRP
jgi:hypothetical protein